MRFVTDRQSTSQQINYSTIQQIVIAYIGSYEKKMQENATFE